MICGLCVRPLFIARRSYGLSLFPTQELCMTRSEELHTCDAESLDETLAAALRCACMPPSAFMPPSFSSTREMVMLFFWCALLYETNRRFLLPWWSSCFFRVLTPQTSRRRASHPFFFSSFLRCYFRCALSPPLHTRSALSDGLLLHA